MNIKEPMLAQEVEAAGLVVIIRSAQPVDLKGVVGALSAAGVRLMEVTLNTPGALEELRRCAGELPEGVFLGAGTILDLQDCKRAVEAGASFIVTPTLQLDSIAYCKAQQVPILCGCLTPTEALAAHRAGADFVKIFPATALGPDYIKDLLGPLPFLKLVPTGGVERSNLGEFFRAGCSAVAVGGRLASVALMQTQDWAELEIQAREYVSLVEKARSSPT